MSAMSTLIALLVVALAGSAISAKRLASSAPNVSSAWFLFLGACLGPGGFAFVPPTMISSLHPLLIVATGWMFFIAAIDWLARRRMPGGETTRALEGRAIAGALLHLVVLIAAGRFLLELPMNAAVQLAVVGTWISVDTRVWPILGKGAAPGLRGPREIETGFVLLLLGAVWIQCFSGMPELASLASIGRWAALLVGAFVLGLCLGTLQRREGGDTVQWTYLLGSALLLAGLSARCDLSPVLSLASFGIAYGASAHLQAEASTHLAATGPAVRAPLMVLAGLHIQTRIGADGYWIVVLIMLSRAFVGTLMESTLRKSWPATSKEVQRGGVQRCGEGLAVCAFAVQLGRGGLAGADAFLLVAALSLIVRALVGVVLLRRSAASVGEGGAA